MGDIGAIFAYFEHDSRVIHLTRASQLMLAVSHVSQRDSLQPDLDLDLRARGTDSRPNYNVQLIAERGRMRFDIVTNILLNVHNNGEFMSIRFVTVKSCVAHVSPTFCTAAGISWKRPVRVKRPA